MGRKLQVAVGLAVKVANITFTILAALVLALALFIFLAFLPIFPADQPRIVTRERIGGVEVVATQIRNEGFDGFRVRLYVRREGVGPWEEYFVDSDSAYLYWGSLRASADGRRVVFSGTWGHLAELDLDAWTVALSGGRVRAPMGLVRSPEELRPDSGSPGELMGYPPGIGEDPLLKGYRWSRD